MTPSQRKQNLIRIANEVPPYQKAMYMAQANAIRGAGFGGKRRKQKGGSFTGFANALGSVFGDQL
jgi:hypothetical protein